MLKLNLPQFPQATSKPKTDTSTQFDSLLDAPVTGKLLPAQEEQASEPEPTHEVFAKIKDLKEALLLLHPNMPVLLQSIHKQLQNDPAVVTVLKEEDIAVLIEALKVQTNTELVTATKPKKKEKVTIDDI